MVRTSRVARRCVDVAAGRADIAVPQLVAGMLDVDRGGEERRPRVPHAVQGEV
jgi:hypothetical protein